MARRQEFQEDCRVDGQIAANTDAPKAVVYANGREVGGGGGDEAEDGGDEDGEVKGPPAAKDVAAKAPEHGAEKEADVLGEGKEGRFIGVELVFHRLFGRQYRLSPER